MREGNKEILILKNNSDEGPGIIANLLQDNGISYRIVDLDREHDPLTFEKFGAVIILGGPDSANDSTRKMEEELRFINNLTRANVPYLGICLGMQTLVKAAGGDIVKCEIKETGFRDQNKDFYKVELTREGEGDRLFKGMENSFNVFHLHGETVILPEKMKLLATGKFCRNQVVKSGSNSYGIQFHLELTPEMFEDWINSDPDLMRLDKNLLRSDFNTTREKYRETGAKIFQNFLRIAKYI